MVNGASEALDLVAFDSALAPAERAVQREVREFVDTAIRPHIADWYERAVFPTEIVGELGRLGLLGMHLDDEGCPGRTAVEYGLAAMELEAGDSGLRTFVSVQGSLAMTAISRHGSPEQRAQWLPAMAAGEAIGCFALTEPGSGSDPASMVTFARRDGSDWVLSGTKRWIGLASIAHIAVVWAQTTEGVRGFLVPTGSAGFTATVIEPKLSLRASIQCEVSLDEVRLPQAAMLPGARGLRGPFTCLNEARYGICWGVLGAAWDSLEAARNYALTREQFARPIAGFQLTQQKLVEMSLGLSTGLLLALRLGRLKDAGQLQTHQISAGKLVNTRTAIEIARTARTILGGNGVSMEHSPLRHANNLESVRTYEGTDEVHTLVLGQHLTGLAAFR